jgi:hypothetical protein
MYRDVTPLLQKVETQGRVQNKYITITLIPPDLYSGIT